MRTLMDEIRDLWDIDIKGYAQEIESVSSVGYPAWTVKYVDKYGVAIPCTYPEIVNESFSNVKLYSDKLTLSNGSSVDALYLTSTGKDLEVPFAAVCADIVSPGSDGKLREQICLDPVLWWKDWKEILGNRNIDERVYDILGELVVYDYLISKKEDADWNGPNGSSYDIETPDCFIEVKSTIAHGKLEATISNQFQLDPPNKKLNLVFCQFEPTMQTGISINDVVNSMQNKGLNVADVNEKLKKRGFEEGKSIRNKKFILHSLLKYEVDEHFPRISPASFVGGVLPPGVIKISYTIDMSMLVPERLDYLG